MIKLPKKAYKRFITNMETWYVTLARWRLSIVVTFTMQTPCEEKQRYGAVFVSRPTKVN